MGVRIFQIPQSQALQRCTFSSKKVFNFSSNHFKSSLLSPGPPAQCPQIEGNTSICPIPGFMFANSISESSGLVADAKTISKSLHKSTKGIEFSSDGAYGKYKSVFPGRTRVFALMPCIASSKLPLYGSCREQSPLCQVCNIVSMFSGSGKGVSSRHSIRKSNGKGCYLTFGASPLLPKANQEGLQIRKPKVFLMELLTIKALAEAPVPRLNTRF